MNLNLGSNGWSDLVRDAFVVGIGAGLTYVLQNVAGLDFGELPKEVIITVASVAVNYVRKVLNIF